jgi:hypothetical protein
MAEKAVDIPQPRFDTRTTYGVKMNSLQLHHT